MSFLSNLLNVTLLILLLLFGLTTISHAGTYKISTSWNAPTTRVSPEGATPIPFTLSEIAGYELCLSTLPNDSLCETIYPSKIPTITFSHEIANDGTPVYLRVRVIDTQGARSDWSPPTQLSVNPPNSKFITIQIHLDYDHS